MWGMQQQQQLRQAVNAELERRKLSVLAASDLFEIDRNTLSRLAKGRRPSLEIAERWARAIEQDVNRWRDLCGYPTVQPVFDPDATFNEGIRRLREEFGVDFQVSTESIWLARQSPEQIEQMLAAFRARLEERRKRG